MQTVTKAGLDALLTPGNCVLLLIDRQPSQVGNASGDEPTMVINKVTALAKTAKAYWMSSPVPSSGLSLRQYRS
jgi:hypothetical protein